MTPAYQKVYEFEYTVARGPRALHGRRRAHRAVTTRDRQGSVADWGCMRVMTKSARADILLQPAHHPPKNLLRLRRDNGGR